MYSSETNTADNYGILPPCPVNDCINHLAKNELGIIHECCKFEHTETLRPCKFYKKLKDKH